MSIIQVKGKTIVAQSKDETWSIVFHICPITGNKSIINIETPIFKVISSKNSPNELSLFAAKLINLTDNEYSIVRYGVSEIEFDYIDTTESMPSEVPEKKYKEFIKEFLDKLD